jgi:glyoxylase-like metal-dependent hydrolase (beta-lactamase superfamily II)
MDFTRAKITILVDNRAGGGLVAEHGLSIWIEADDRQVLFDTGQGQALALNAAALGVDLRQTGTLVLSHGHFDLRGSSPLGAFGPGAHLLMAKRSDPRRTISALITRSRFTPLGSDGPVVGKMKSFS